MAWLQIHLTTSSAEAEGLERLLEHLGALSITLRDAGDEPLLEPGPGEQPVWSQTVVTGLFEASTDPEALRAAILAAAGEGRPLRFRAEQLADRAWERAWMDGFRPMRFGDRLWICPRGQRPPDPKAVTVELDPGLAFGTGTHPTTRLCLEWLAGTDLAGREVIDLGCGSGVLAIAALKLGARRVTAVDHDPQALLATRENAEANGVLDRLAVAERIAGTQPPVDILLANILAATLVNLEPEMARCVKPGGRVALSGILRGQEGSVQDAFAPDFDRLASRADGEWLLLAGRRRGD